MGPQNLGIFALVFCIFLKAKSQNLTRCGAFRQPKIDPYFEININDCISENACIAEVVNTSPFSSGEIKYMNRKLNMEFI